MHGLLRCNINTGGADVSLRDVTIALMGNRARECGWCHAPEARRIWGILKKSVSWVQPREKTVSFRLLAEARPVALWWLPHGKVIIERLCISLPYVETFNSKVIKGFVPELRSYVFFVFRDSYVLCIYVMNILCTFHISIPGYGTILLKKNMVNLFGNTKQNAEILYGSVWTAQYLWSSSIPWY